MSAARLGMASLPVGVVLSLNRWARLLTNPLAGRLHARLLAGPWWRSRFPLRRPRRRAVRAVRARGVRLARRGVSFVGSEIARASVWEPRLALLFAIGASQLWVGAGIIPGPRARDGRGRRVMRSAVPFRVTHPSRRPV
ncbi:MAG: hypothetical protein M3O91_02080 [Chloroflexota bacterium]|nr:hypothetical protein [Chloroflexota bacterium]